MKRKIFTLLIAALFATGLNLYAQSSPEGSTGWETLQPGEPLLLEEDFQGFSFLHFDSHPNEGSSSNEDPLNLGYREDSTSYVIATGSKDTIFYNFYQCAFAPNWEAAYAYRDSADNALDDQMTPQVTRGFVEISREYSSTFTVNGSFTIDLRQLEFVEVVQYSHSSCGGNKRGYTLEVSTDNGEVWDTLRMQTGNITTSRPQPNSFDCQNSGYAMRWEDGIWNFNVMLRFTQSSGQAPRIHDLKVYGTPSTVSSIENYEKSEIGIVCINKIISLSETSDIGIYDLGGALLRRADMVNTYSVSDLPEGLYIVRAKTNTRTTTRKILLK